MHHTIEPLSFVSNFTLLFLVESLQSVNTSTRVLSVLPVSVVSPETALKDLDSKPVSLSISETSDVNALNT
jgi:hypothetical protein